MALRFLLIVICVAELASLIDAGGHGGGGHKKVIIHVPYKVKHHHHTHTIVKHIHHKEKPKDDKDDDDKGDKYEVLGYTYGNAKGHGGHGWGVDDGGASYGDAPTSFEGGEHNFGLSSSDYGGDEHGY